MMKFAWLGCIVALACLSARAQSASPSIPDFEFSVMATDRLREVAYVQLKPEAANKPRPVAADFDIVPLRVNSQGRSDLYRFTGPGPLRFVRTRGRGDSLAVEQVLATVNAPASRGRSLFVLYPGNGDALEVVALDDEPAAFPARHLRLLNLAGEPLALLLDGRGVQLDATPRVLPPRPVDGGFKLGVAMARQGRAVPIFDQSFVVGEDERLFVVFLPPFRPGADVRTRVVRDTIAPPPAATE